MQFTKLLSLVILASFSVFAGSKNTLEAFETAVNNAEHAVSAETFPSEYQAIRVLGKGSFGRAYLVKDKDSGEQLVLKAVLGYYPWALREHIIINHPAVNLGMGDLITKNGYYYIPMKYVKGELYSTYLPYLMLTKKGRQTIKDIEIKLIDEMKRLHQAGIVHLDIAPRNIIIDKETQMPTFIDYGKAKFSKKIDDQEKDLSVLLNLIGQKPERDLFSGGKNSKKTYEDIQIAKIIELRKMPRSWDWR